MNLTHEIKEAFNKFFMIYMGLATVGLLVKSLPFTLHNMKTILLISSAITAYLFIKKNKRFLLKKEYIQMIIFATVIHLITTMYLFYKIYGLQFFKYIRGYIINLDPAILLSTFTIVVIPALVIAFFFSKIMWKWMKITNN